MAAIKYPQSWLAYNFYGDVGLSGTVTHCAQTT